MSRKSLDLTLGFLRSMDRSASSDDVSRLLLASLGSFGIEHLMAGTVPMPGTPSRQQRAHVLLDTMPVEWKRRYLSGGYVFRDPTVKCLMTAASPFSWSESLSRCGDDARAQRVMNEAGDFRLREGISVPLLTLDGETAGFSFSGERIEVSVADRGMLQLVATYAFGHLLLIHGQRFPSAPARLAPRERESLQWAAEGKTDWEIGAVMGISMHGVDFHLRSARTKLGTTNRTQAVATALRLGLIS